MFACPKNERRRGCDELEVARRAVASGGRLVQSRVVPATRCLGRSPLRSTSPSHPIHARSRPASLQASHMKHRPDCVRGSPLEPSGPAFPSPKFSHPAIADAASHARSQWPSEWRSMAVVCLCHRSPSPILPTSRLGESPPNEAALDRGSRHLILWRARVCPRPTASLLAAEL